MGRVFVIQRQMQLDRERNEFVDRFDLTPAEEYGELVYLLNSTAAPWKTDTILIDLEEKLQDFTEDDFLLLVGNPVLIGLATAVASSKVDRVSFLQWSGKDRRYLPVVANINLSCEYI